MDKFYIITNRDKDQNLRFTEEIVQYLKDHGKKCQVQQAERKTEGTYHYTDPELIPEGISVRSAFLRKSISHRFMRRWINFLRMTTK